MANLTKKSPETKFRIFLAPRVGITQGRAYPPREEKKESKNAFFLWLPEWVITQGRAYPPREEKKESQNAFFLWLPEWDSNLRPID